MDAADGMRGRSDFYEDGYETGNSYPYTKPDFENNENLQPPPQKYRPNVETSVPTRASIKFVDDILAHLDWGNIAFNAPSTMKYKQPQLVELLLSPSLSIAQLQEQLDQIQDAESARVRISNRMEAQLTGRGFTIQALTPHLQAITSETSRWRWEVTPTEHGKQRIYLALLAHIAVAGRDAPLVVRTFDRTIEVTITPSQRVSGFVQDNWQWLWTAVFIPIAAYICRRRKK